MANIDDFKKIELIVAQIKEVKEHPNADRLYLLQVDTGRMISKAPAEAMTNEGDPQPASTPVKDVRQIVAGIRKAYTPEQLVGRRVVLVANLEPAVIRGETSHGMLLAASDANGMSLLTPDKDITLGSIVK